MTSATTLNVVQYPQVSTQSQVSSAVSAGTSNVLPPVYSDKVQISNTGSILSNIRKDARENGSPYDKQRVKQLKEQIVKKPYPAEVIADIIAEKIVYGY